MTINEVNSMHIAVILLGAGRSSRLGSPKSFFLVDGQPWLFHQLAGLARAQLEQFVAMVVGPNVDSQMILPRDGLVAVVNPAPDRGSFSSLHCGVSAVLEKNPECVGAFVLPIDTPVGCPEVWYALAAELAERPFDLRCVRPFCAPLGRRGHPVLLSRPLLEMIAALDPMDANLRLDRILRSLQPGQISDVAVDDVRVLLNLNTKEDWGAYPNLVLANPTRPLQAKNRFRATAFCIDEGKILVTVLRDPVSGVVYRLPPGGKVEENESAEDAAIRETFEETGVKVRVKSVQPQRRSYLFPWNGSLVHATTDFFLTEVIGHDICRPDADYIEGVEWITLAQAAREFACQKETLEVFLTLTLN